MEEAATVTTVDAESGEEAVVIVRFDERRVALCISLLSGPDVEVVMPKSDAAKVLEALQSALTTAKS